MKESRKYIRARRIAQWHDDALRVKRDWSIGYGDYCLWSMDGGKNWYAVDQSNDMFIVRGPAEEVFHGLIKQINGFEALATYAKKNRPVTLSGERSATDRAMLEGACFTVTSTR